MQHDQDTQLMLEFQRGDAESFNILFRKYSVSLITFVYRFLGDRTKAEELAQEVLLKVYTARESYHPKAKFSTWVYRIATNLCLNELRRKEYRQAHISLDDPDKVHSDHCKQLADDRIPSPEQDLEEKYFEEAFNRSIKLLPARQRAAFLLNKFSNASYRDVATVLGCSESSVKSLIHRAAVSLKDHLKDYIMKS